MRNTKTCGEAIVALLEAYGVEIVFGIPGVHTLELYRGLVGSKIRHVLPRHEQGAGFMADGYARASGKPGVCFLITGPGVTNAATPIGQAYSDSVPMLVISSVNEVKHLGRGRGELHELPDQQKLMSACTAFSERISDPSEFPAVLARAYDVFNSARPRPVHIEVPIDIFEKPVEESWEVLSSTRRAEVGENEIVAAANLLANAERPIIIAGGGALGGETALLELAEKLDAPVATSIAGSGLIPCSHGLSLGPTLVCQATHDLIGTADVVLVVGSELASTDTWGIDFQFNGKLIRIDIDETQFTNRQKPDLALCGDAPAALAGIATRLPAKADPGRRAAREREVKTALAAFEAGLSDEEKLRAKVFDAVVGALPSDALVACDMTQIGYTGHSVFRPETSGRMLFPNGYGTLGYGLPAGLGASLGAAEKSTVVFSGDGGVLYTLQEMGTAVEEKLPVLLILWNNSSLYQIREGFIEHGIEPIAVDPLVPDFQMIAKGFGWTVHKTRDLAGLGRLVSDAHAKAQADRHPVLIEIDALAL